MELVFDRAENVVEIGGKAGNQHFVPIIEHKLICTSFECVISICYENEGA